MLVIFFILKYKILILFAILVFLIYLYLLIFKSTKNVLSLIYKLLTFLVATSYSYFFTCKRFFYTTIISMNDCSVTRYDFLINGHGEKISLSVDKVKNIKFDIKASIVLYETTSISAILLISSALIILQFFLLVVIMFRAFYNTFFNIVGLKYIDKLKPLLVMINDFSIFCRKVLIRYIIFFIIFVAYVELFPLLVFISCLI